MFPAERRILILERPRRVRFAAERVPTPGRGDVVVRPLLSTFKHGTEMMAYLGRTPFARRRFDPALRLFEPVNGANEFYPRPMGSMMVGTVEWAGADVTRVRCGARVFAWAPVADLHVLPAVAVRPLGRLAPEQALCIDPASFALGGVLDGAVRRGETVLVTGLGAIGLFAVQYCVAAGAKVIAASGFAKRRALARSFGAAAVYDPGAVADLARDIKRRGGGVDAAIECSSSLAALDRAIRATRQCGRIVCVGFHGGEKGRLDLGAEFYHNRLTLLASLPAHSWGNPVRGRRPLFAADLQRRAARDFRRGAVSAAGLLTPALPFADAARAMRLISDAPADVVKVVLEHEPGALGGGRGRRAA
jgi:threonine dehydrogenase-like Zn-dependent dehydrogenase